MSRTKRMYLIVSMYLSLIRIDYALKKHGFEYIFDKYTTKFTVNNPNKSNRAQDPGESTKKVAEKIISMIYKVIRFYPLKAECIQRSLLILKYIRRVAGIEVDMVVGVKKHPFESHAWIEFNGTSLTEPEEKIRDFMIILTSRGGIPQ